MNDTEVRTQPRHPIRVVTRRTGLSPSVLRAWERRYGAVEPGRSEGGQRLYSDEHVERLALLVKATEAGRSIGQVAGLTDDELARLVAEDASIRPPAPAGQETDATRLGGDVVAEALEAIKAMDPGRLEKTLTRAAVVMEPAPLVDGVLLPMLTRIGQLWRHGAVGPANEHLASVVVRKFLEWLIGAIEVPGDSPVLVCATPAGHRHELGALLTGVVAAGVGWRPIFLGPDLPAEDIAAAARRLGASGVAISAIHPADDPSIPREFATLMALLAPGTRVFAGGGAVLRHREDVEASGAEVLSTMGELRGRLSEAGSGVGFGRV